MNVVKEKIKYWPIYIIIVLTAILYLFTFRCGHNWGGDFSQYIAQAKGIAEGSIRKIVNYSDYRFRMSSYYVGPKLYPWGFPLLLSPIYLLFGLNIFAMKVYVSLFFLLSIFVIFLLFKDKLPYSETLLLATLFALNPYFLFFKDNVLSDIPFLFFSLFTIYLIQQIVISKRVWINKFVSLSLLGFFMFFSYYIRSQGIVLIPTLFISQYIADKKQFKQNLLLSLLPYIVFLILLAGFGVILPSGSGSYMQGLSILNKSIIRGNIRYYFKLPLEFFGHKPISKLLFYTSIPFALWGIIKNIKKDYHYITYMVFTMGILIFWPYRQGLRFIFTLLPFYIYFTFIGLPNISVSDFVDVKNKTLDLNLIHIFGIVLILTYIPDISNYIHDYSYQFCFSGKNVLDGPYTKESKEMFKYIIENTSKNDVIIFWKPRVMTLYTDRRSIIVLRLDEILKSEAKYIVWNRGYRMRYNPYLGTILRTYTNNFKLVFNNNAFKIYKIVKKDEIHY